MKLSNASCKHTRASVRCAHVSWARPKVATSLVAAATSSSMRDSRPLEMLERGALIVLEGGDRSGKSTQIRLLAKKLEERGVSTHCQLRQIVGAT